MKRLLNTLVQHMANAGGNLDHWVVATVIALFVSLGTASLIHGVEQHDNRLANQEAAFLAMQQQMEARLVALERGQHPGTAKRYTADDAARDRDETTRNIQDLRRRLALLESIQITRAASPHP